MISLSMKLEHKCLGKVCTCDFSTRSSHIRETICNSYLSQVVKKEKYVVHHHCKTTLYIKIVMWWDTFFFLLKEDFIKTKQKEQGQKKGHRHLRKEKLRTSSTRLLVEKNPSR
ncbi:hypothetical protein TorRG33x02_198200, partial [Trema orientale]